MCLHFRDYAEQRHAGMSDAELRTVLNINGMKHVSIEFLTDWFMDGEAGEIARRNEAIAFQAANAFGANVLNVGPDLAGRDIPIEIMRERFAALCGRAAIHGIAIALELVAWGNVREVDTALLMIDGVPNAGLVIDSWHIFRANVPLHHLKRIPAERVLCVQVNDAEAEPAGMLATDTMCRKLCGQGAFDLSAFVETLDAMGVQLPLSVEIISPEQSKRDLPEAASVSLASARRCFDLP
ncbi:sugar phosphate isomerase/epimerase [Aminobacter sp. AP02]|nr:sugar phosphate isomerase/epimerase [Aminobacter sp. AP02]